MSVAISPERASQISQPTIDDQHTSTRKERARSRVVRFLYYPLSIALMPFQVPIAFVIHGITKKMFASASPLSYENYRSGSLSSAEISALSSPVTLANGAKVRNRIVKAGITDGLADRRGNPTDRECELYRRYSAGGFGMIISPSTSPDRRSVDPSIGNTPILDSQSDLESFKKLAIAMKGEGEGLALLQLAHPGPLVAFNQRAVAPGPFLSKSGRNLVTTNCHVLTTEEIEEIIQMFVNSVQLAQQCGFDGIEVLAANGYLGSTFMSKHINNRTDRWAGDAFITELMKRLIAARSSPEFVIGIKLNSSDLQKGGLTQEEALVTMKKLSEIGIDFIEIGGGTYQHMDTRYSVNKLEGTSANKRESFFIDFAERVRDSRDITCPILTVGGWKDVKAMAQAAENNRKMLIGFGRASCVDPNLGNRLLEGNISEIPNWFSDQRPDWISGLVNSPSREKRTTGFAIQMLWHALAACSLANGDETPRVQGILDNPPNALAFKIFLFMKGFLPKRLQIPFFKSHPLANFGGSEKSKTE